MSILISSINYSPVKSLSFQEIKSCNIKKDLGILNDRKFAFSRGVDLEKAKLIEKNPNERKLNNFLTLKNSPVLNKYNFTYIDNELVLKIDDKELISISTDDLEQQNLLSDKLIELEDSLVKPITLLKNKDFPFFDTSHSNNIFNSFNITSKSENFSASLCKLISSSNPLKLILHCLYGLSFSISSSILNLLRPLSSIKYLPSEVSLKLVILPKQPISCKAKAELFLFFLG